MGGHEVTLSATSLSVVLGVTLSLGVLVGYKIKSWRIEWLKRRRERLQRKIQQTQAEIEMLQKHH